MSVQIFWASGTFYLQLMGLTGEVDLSNISYCAEEHNQICFLICIHQQNATQKFYCQNSSCCCNK